MAPCASASGVGGLARADDEGTDVNGAANYDSVIRRNRRIGIATLGFVVFGVLLTVLTGDHLSASTWTVIALMTLVGLGELFTARLLQLDRDDPAGVERRERRFEAVVIAAGVGLPLAALLAVAALVVLILLR